MKEPASQSSPQLSPELPPELSAQPSSQQSSRLSPQLSQSADTPLYYLFLGLLFWMPLPLGSNRWWALSLFELWALGLALGWLALYWRGRVELNPVFTRALPAVALLGCAAFWVVLQGSTLPAGVVAALSPAAAVVQGQTDAHASLSLNVHATRGAAVETLCLLLVFCLTLLLVDSRRRLRQLAALLVISGVCQAAYGSLMTLSGLEYGFFFEKEAYRGVATGTFVNRNHLAGYLEMCLAVGIGLLLSDLGRRRATSLREGVRRFLSSLLGSKGLLRLSLAVMVIALVLTHSRMGNTAFFSALFATGLLYLIARKRLTRGSIIFFASLLLVDVLIVGNFFGVEKVVERLQETSSAAEYRDEVARESLGIIADYPVAGTGSGSYYSTYPSYASGEVEYRYPYDHAHNDYIEFASELGLPGFAMLAAAVIFCLYCGLRALFRRRDPLMQGCAFASVMGCVSLLIHSLTDFNLQIPANAGLFVIVLALGIVGLAGQFQREPAPA